MRTESLNTPSQHNEVLGAEARAVIEADFKDIQPHPKHKDMKTRIKDAIGHIVSQGQRA
jgi:hypothetical protein